MGLKELIAAVDAYEGPVGENGFPTDDVIKELARIYRESELVVRTAFEFREERLRNNGLTLAEKRRLAAEHALPAARESEWMKKHKYSPNEMAIIRREVWTASREGRPCNWKRVTERLNQLPENQARKTVRDRKAVAAIAAKLRKEMGIV